MPIHVGNSDNMSQIHIGNANIGSVYVGHNLVWGKYISEMDWLGCAVNTLEHPRWDYHSMYFGSDIVRLRILPSGMYRGALFGATYDYIGRNCWLWFRTETNPVYGNFVKFGFDSGEMIYGAGEKCLGLSIRCLRDASKAEQKLSDAKLIPQAYTDGDGQDYDGVKIGNQIWITENLKSTRYQNGDPITTGLTDQQFTDSIEGAYTAFPYYSNKIIPAGSFVTQQAQIDAYGLLYNWYAANNGLVGGSWRIPDKGDMQNLLNHVVTNYPPYNYTTIGIALKSCLQMGHPIADYDWIGCAINTSEVPSWKESDNYGIDLFRFNLLPAGNINDTFFDGSNTILLTDSLLYGTPDTITAYMTWSSNDNFHKEAYEINGVSVYSVRLVRNAGYIEQLYPDGYIFINQYADADGNVYDGVKIGEQIWTTKNLMTTKFQSGYPIPNEIDDVDWAAAITNKTPAYRWAYNDYDNYGKHYGCWYNPYTIATLVADSDWRVPSVVDMDKLIAYVEITIGMGAAKVLKSCRQNAHSGGEIKTVYFMLQNYHKKYFGITQYYYDFLKDSPNLINVGSYVNDLGVRLYYTRFDNGSYKLYKKTNADPALTIDNPNMPRESPPLPYIPWDRYENVELIHTYKNPTYDDPNMGKPACVVDITVFVNSNNERSYSVGYHEPTVLNRTDEYFINIVEPHVPAYVDIE